jgi:hypothetical protein
MVDHAYSLCMHSGVNLAVPILYKRMVDVLSQVRRGAGLLSARHSAWLQPVLSAAVHLH